MNHRPLFVIVVVALVVLAGCSGLAPGGNSTGNGTNATQTTQSAATDTPTQTTTTATGEATTTASMTAVPMTTSTAASMTQMSTSTTAGTAQTTTGNGTQSGMAPQGYAASGITNPQRAIEHHRAALSASGSYTVTLNLSTARRQFTLVRQVNIANERAYTTVTANVRGSSLGINIAIYQSGNTRYTKTAIFNRTRYNVTKRPFAFNGLNQSVGRATLLGNVSFGSAERVTRNGKTLLRYESTELQNAKPFLPLLATNATVNEFNATILVGQKGIIRSISYSVTYTTAGGERKTRAVTVRLSHIGSTSIQDPAWLDEAKAQTSLSGTGTPGAAGNATTTING